MRWLASPCIWKELTIVSIPINQNRELCLTFSCSYSLLRLGKGHSESLELLYGLVNAFLLVLALLTRRPSLLVGLFGLGWYQGYRAVDVFSRSEHYASSLQLFDDLCVLARCVHPYKSRPEF